MPKRKANWWPPSILSDPDVLSVDDEGRFVLCKICHVHYAVHGGKKPKPVIMNSNFRTRAWDVHKERTNSHRLQKQQERLQQAKMQQQQEPPAATDTQSQGQQQQVQEPTETQSGPIANPVLPHQVQGQGQTPAPRTPQHTALRSQSGGQVPPQQQHLEMKEQEPKDATGEQVQSGNSPIQQPTSNSNPETLTAATMAGPNSMHGNDVMSAETGDLGSNNSERVAKKLRSLNAEYHASNMRHGDALNMRHTDVFDRRSAGYKEYWGTLRDVYTSSGTITVPAPVNSTAYRKAHHRSNSLSRPLQDESKETEADSTTPDDSGSSEDAAFKPAVVVHDASLFNAIERLTEATSKQVASLYQKEAADTREALVGLTSVMTDLRVQHGNAFSRIIELQEKHLKTMESILEIKLRKEAARSTKNSSSKNESTSAGTNPERSTNEASVASDEIADGGFRDQHQ
ncbi:hypothetical protein PHMEG_0009192 [Phytophthora megakarya]|uniref:Uncharacterized protein n=1 Tax=Phytophthora megakarya TaxID=4795 RepID=A0A225WHE3_9STRA|nr:hypothetical protein PHMEG_0009192 [Phytophthora megakarya]